MVRNLLDNALRYTPTGGTVTVSLHGAQPSAWTDDAPSVVFLRVTDSGPGIPEAERDRIFERFHRAPAAMAHESASQPWRSGGSGLGLAICRATVESHGGRIWVESGGEGGASFVVTLPALDSR
jgi:two-component system sensor histidine kinase BaeS